MKKVLLRAIVTKTDPWIVPLDSTPGNQARKNTFLLNNLNFGQNYYLQILDL